VTEPDAARPRAEIVVDLDAVRHNVASLAKRAAPAELMVVVKADGYGHGMLEVAAAAREAGAPWLGVAVLEEAMALRAAGDTGQILAWLAVPGEDYGPAISAEVDVTAYTVREVEEISRAALAVNRSARLQLKVDTGLSRGGAARHEWAELFRAAMDAEEEGLVTVTGIWSHFACSDEPEHPANDVQAAAFEEALALAESAGLTPGIRHLANSAATLVRPSARFDLVRCGLAAYGLSPVPQLHTSADLGLTPAMTARTRAALVKRVAAGSGVSYGHTYVTPTSTTVALVPVGYGDGVPRHGSSSAPVQVAGSRRKISGRVCMDQFVVDIDDDVMSVGDEVVLFGPGSAGEPTAQDWAEACGTISYEIVTRIGGRFRRTFTGLRPGTVTNEAGVQP